MRVTSLPLTGTFSTRSQIVLGSCVCAAAATFLYAVDPSHHSVYPQCLLYKATGLYCAGCGATRAIHALLHGQIGTALRDNILFTAALPLLVFVAGSYALTAWKANAWPSREIDSRSLLRWGVGVFLLMISFMILRNLPGWPFEYLRPLP